jgi:glycosyltransferase involved in cell wall biosynthesis
VRLVNVDSLVAEAPGITRRLRQRVTGADAVVWTSTPLPVRVARDIALFPVIYDLRWLRTRGPLARVYRAVDLARQIRRCRGILTISETVASQLALFTARPIRVLPMGPGQFEGYPRPRPRDTKTIVLMGGAAHKRNELAARMLCASRLVREQYSVVGVRVSDECARILHAGMPPGRVDLHGLVPRDALAEILDRSSTYLSLGTTEGFGFPYVEAAYFGCDVIAPDGPLTREVLGGMGRLLPNSTPTAEELDVALEGWDEPRISALQASTAARSWTATAESAATFISALMRRA